MVHLIMCLLLALHFHTSLTRRRSASENQWSRHRRWTSGLEDRRGHQGHQYRAEEPDPELLLEEEHANSTQIVDMDHVYYTSKVYGRGDTAGKELWADVDEMEDEQKLRVFLSNSQRHTERVNLSFSFPFYGHLLKEVTVATGGFIYTGDRIHRMLTATQYIAPLMADFDLGLCKNSSVFYLDNGTALVVQWDQVHLQSNVSLGAFTFQAILLSDGRIVFAYKEIPIDISDIGSESHPVKVGLSDAFVVLHEIEQIPNVRRRTIYEYHKVDILGSKISNCTAVEMIPLPTCLQFLSCSTCVTSQIGFNCSWCSKLQRQPEGNMSGMSSGIPRGYWHLPLRTNIFQGCSSGFDRSRQDWVDLGCPEERRDPQCSRGAEAAGGPSRPSPGTTTPAAAAAAGRHDASGLASTPLSRTPTALRPAASASSRTASSAMPPPSESPEDDGETSLHISEAKDGGRTTEGHAQLQVGLLAGIVVMTTVIAAAVGMSVYVYNHPTSVASLFFMERRPTRWPILKFRRGSGRPSYAEVEALDLDKDGSTVIDPKQSFVMSDRRESEQKEGFIVPDQRELFLRSESS